MVAGTSAFDGSRNSTVVLETVVAFTDSLNVAVILASAAMPVAPCAGNVEVTVGGVVSGAPLVVKTTSTQ